MTTGADEPLRQEAGKPQREYAVQRDQDLPGEAKEPKEAMEKGEDSEDAKDNGEDGSGEWTGIGEISMSWKVST